MDANKKMSQTELINKKVRSSATLVNGHALQVNEGKQLTIGFGFIVAQVFCPSKHSNEVIKGTQLKTALI